MQKTHTRLLHKTILVSAMATAIGTTLAPSAVNADIYVWGSTTPDLIGANTAFVIGLADYTTICADSTDPATVTFTMLDSTGTALANSSITAKGANQFQTPTCGTLMYDTETESGTATIAPFDFFSGTTPALATGINLEKIAGGSGNLIMANMLFDWNGNTGIPVSLVWDGQGILSEMDGTPTSFTLNADGSINTAGVFSDTGVAPAADGTYTNAAFGYLGMGPVPLASTEFNLTREPTCGTAAGACLGISPSGKAPLVTDTAVNVAEFAMGDGAGIGGVPMWDGPFTGFNANFEFNDLKLVSFTDETPPHITITGGSDPVIVALNGTYTEQGATCTDAAPLNTNLNGVVGIGGDTVIGNEDTGGTFTVSYSCQDVSTNAATQDTNRPDPITRTVLIAPAGAPLIGLKGIDPAKIECNFGAPPVYVDEGAVCADFEDGEITGTDAPNAGNLFSVNIAAVDTGAAGNYSAVWSCTDSNPTNNLTTKNRTVTVEDTTAPVITITGNNPENILLSSTADNPVAAYADAGATAADSCDQTAIGVTSTDTVDVVVPDDGPETVQYQVVYDATDASGNPAQEARIVNVTRAQPVISLNGVPNPSLNVGDVYTELGMKIDDAQDGNSGTVLTSGTDGTFTWTITGAVDTATKDTYPITYTAVDADGNNATTVERSVLVGAFAKSSNFTMLDPQGKAIGGTNDVVFDWPAATAVLGPAGDGIGGDQSSLNTVESDTKFNMTILSAKPEPFRSFVWTAHHVRVFGPGTYKFDTSCSTGQLEAGTCPTTGTTLTMTVGPNQLGAHMLFDWNTTSNIDVVNVWDINGIWNDPDGAATETNNMHTGSNIDHVSGFPSNPAQPFKLISRDINGNGFNGSPMVDGPFKGFHANFNAGGVPATSLCFEPTELDPDTGECVIAVTVTDNPEDEFLGAIGWTTLFGLLPMLGLLRRRKTAAK